MTLRATLPLLTALLAGSAVTALAAPLPVTDAVVSRSTATYDIEVHYPVTGLAPIDTEIKGFVDGNVDDFVGLAEEDLSGTGGGEPIEGMVYGLDIGYETARNDDALFAALFSISMMTGGAHPNHDFETFNYLRPDGWRVYLPEIFDNRGLKTISELAIADLTRELTGPDGSSDPDWIKDGAGPAWANFADFILLSDALVIHFPPYQVAAYAAGPQEVTIPLDALVDFQRPDWRAPAASFDCGKAGTAVEKAICSSVPLARLDREVSDAYANALDFATDDADREKIKNEQRAWIGTRDESCGGDAACLTRVYDDRLAALKAASEG